MSEVLAGLQQGDTERRSSQRLAEWPPGRGKGGGREEVVGEVKEEMEGGREEEKKGEKRQRRGVGGVREEREGGEGGEGEGKQVGLQIGGASHSGGGQGGVSWRG